MTSVNRAGRKHNYFYCKSGNYNDFCDPGIQVKPAVARPARSFHKGRKAKALLAFSAVLAGMQWLSPSTATATTQTWDGLGIDNNWKDPGNWVGSVVPSANDVLVFDGANRLSPNNNFTTGTMIGGIVFAPTAAGPFVLGGNAIQLNGNITDNTQ